MKHVLPAIRIFLFMTLLTGVAYPLLVTGIANLTTKDQASGSLIEKNGTLVGSELIGQKFESDRYFWPRPSAVEYNPLPSGGSNLGQASECLKETVDERVAKLKMKSPGRESLPPQDLLFASGSGLDPHISPEAAQFQVDRIALVRRLEPSAVHKLVQDLTEPRQFGMFGEPRVIVLKLNLALDNMGR